MFEALVRLRLQIEPIGWLLALQASRLDAYPSGTDRDMGGGYRIYVVRPGLKARRGDRVSTLDDAPAELLGTVADQKAHRSAWLAEPNKADYTE